MQSRSLARIPSPRPVCRAGRAQRPPLNAANSTGLCSVHAAPQHYKVVLAAEALDAEEALLAAELLAALPLLGVGT